MANPYRVARPLAGIVFEGVYVFPGGSSDQKLRVALTSDYFWINENLSIPVAAILGVETVGDKVVRVVYHNALNGANEGVELTARNWVGRADKQQVWNLANAITNTRARAPSIEAFLADLENGAGGRVPSCETCGAVPARQIELALVGSIGVIPIAGYYFSRPYVRLYCRAHAVKECCTLNAATGIAGFIGFPGIITAPIQVWKNARSVRDAHNLGTARYLLLIAAGWWFAGPVLLLTAVALVYRLLEQ
ncbi:MAG: hypothetical protein K8I27_16120 [Planctomycetes bacterium]|nr:hypothetical protein [Planctomycetota bacterium]